MNEGTEPTQYLKMLYEVGGGKGKVGTPAKNYRLEWSWFGKCMRSYSSWRVKNDCSAQYIQVKWNQDESTGCKRIFSMCKLTCTLGWKEIDNKDLLFMLGPCERGACIGVKREISVSLVSAIPVPGDP